MDTGVPFEFLVSLMKYFKTDTEGSLWTNFFKFEIKKKKKNQQDGQTEKSLTGERRWRKSSAF